MTDEVGIVKNDGKRTEKYTRDKLHASIVAACTSARTPDGQANRIARTVCDDIEEWLKDHPEVTSRDIKKQTGRHLNRRHPEAAYLYEQHNMII